MQDSFLCDIINSKSYKLNKYGKIKLKVKVSNHLNNPSSDAKWRKVYVSPRNLHPFIAGFIVSCVIADGTCDAEIFIRIYLKEGKVILMCDPYAKSIISPYIVWPQDGTYVDRDLRNLQNSVDRNPTFVRDVLEKAKNLESPERMALDVGIPTLFAEKVPIAFYEGIAAFQDIVNTSITFLLGVLWSSSGDESDSDD